FRRPGCPFGFIGQFHADKVANKSGWFCHDLVGYWAGAASQGRVNGYQEVLFIPVLSNGEPVGDGIAGDSSDKHDQVGFFYQIIGWFWSTISPRAHIGWRVERASALRARLRETSNEQVF